METRSSVPHISVVIPCYNGATAVSEAIRSVFDQGVDAVEVIVVDDGSTDDSLSVLATWGDRIVVETGPNQGACAARNRGTALAKGDFVLFLDADDILEAPYLKKLAHLAGDDVDAVIGSVVIEDASGKRMKERGWSKVEHARDLLLLQLRLPMQTSAFLWRRSYVIQHGGWDVSLPIAQDSDFAFRMILAGPRFTVAGTGGGSVIWRSPVGAARISTSMSRKKLQSTFDLLRRHDEMLAPMQDREITREMGGRYYGFAKVAFVAGANEMGGIALDRARQRGFDRHDGSTVHRLTATVLGLRGKIRVQGWVYEHVLRRPLEFRPFPYNITRPVEG